MLPESDAGGVPRRPGGLRWLPNNSMEAAMGWNREDDGRRYQVVINHEEQYSVWPAEYDVPKGWKAVGKEGNKADCLAYIEEVWTDMRPLSLRKQMEARDTLRG
jgi:MbtH protein